MIRPACLYDNQIERGDDGCVLCGHCANYLEAHDRKLKEFEENVLSAKQKERKKWFELFK